MSTASEAQANDNYKEVLSAVIMAVVGIAAFLGMPVIVGVLSDGYGLTDTQVGYHASVGMSGGILAAIFVSQLLNRVNRRVLLLVGLFLGAIGHVMTALFQSFDALLVTAFFWVLVVALFIR